MAAIENGCVAGAVTCEACRPTPCACSAKACSWTTWSWSPQARRRRSGTSPATARSGNTSRSSSTSSRGINLGCYSDMTRTFCLGEPPEELVRYHELVREALDVAYTRPSGPASLAPRRTAPRSASSSRARVPDAALEAAGRGARGGLLPQSRPRRRARGARAAVLGGVGEEIVAGDDLAVEPGLYRKGFGGCRLEDLVLVTEDGCEVLTEFPYAMTPLARRPFPRAPPCQNGPLARGRASMVPRRKIDISAADLLFALLACLTRAVAERDERAARHARDRRGWTRLPLGALGASPPRGARSADGLGGRGLGGHASRHGADPRAARDRARSSRSRPGHARAASRSARASRSPDGRAVLVAHLFRSTVPLRPIAAVARRHGLLLVEDCAQSLGASPRGEIASPTISMFSLGPIKTDPPLSAGRSFTSATREQEMRALQSAWPTQRRSAYAARVARSPAWPSFARPVYGALARGSSTSIGSSPAPSWISRRGRRPLPAASPAPSTPLLATMGHRLRPTSEDRRSVSGRRAPPLSSRRAWHVWRRRRSASPLVFPVVASDPKAFVAALRGAGFDALPGHDLDRRPPGAAGPAGLEAHQAQADARGVVFLPAYPELSGRRRSRRLAGPRTPRSTRRSTGAGRPCASLTAPRRSRPCAPGRSTC